MVTVDPSKVLTKAPELPAWCVVSPRAELFYRALCRLPQRRLWNDGDWIALWASLPLVDRYFERLSAEAYKAWTSALFPALRITSDDLAKARVKLAESDAQTPPHLVVMDDYRAAAT